MHSELRHQLERAEEANAAAYRELGRIRKERKGMRAGIQGDLDMLLAEQTSLRDRYDRLLVTKAEADRITGELRRRVTKLVNPWTRLGWFLFRATRPAWRKSPLQDCGHEEPAGRSI